MLTYQRFNLSTYQPHFAIPFLPITFNTFFFKKEFMKKIKSLLSLLALSTLLFTACNNGDYDADPNTDNTDTPNPFEYGGASIGGPGYIKAYLNEDEAVFSPANWQEDATLGRAISGIRKNEDGSMKDILFIRFNGFPNTGDSFLSGFISYTIMLNDSTIKEQYTNEFAELPLTGLVTGFDWYKMLGKFGGFMTRNLPADPEKVIVVSKGFFDVGK